MTSQHVDRIMRRAEGCVAILVGLGLTCLLVWLAYIAFLVWGHHG